MDLVVALDFRFRATPDGALWTPNVFGPTFWSHYLEVFDRVRIVARAEQVREPQPGDLRVDGTAVSFHPVPFYLGPLEYLSKARAVRRSAAAAIAEGDAVILRVGSELAACITPRMQRCGRPYGLEVIGDPHDAFAPGAIRHPFRPFFRWRNTRLLKRQCARACGAAYVTGAALQKRYPCTSYAAAVSDVELPADYWKQRPGPRFAVRERRLIFVGSLDQMYKAPDVMIDALAICLRSDPSFYLTLIGSGRHLPELRLRAAALGIQERIRFTGQLPAGAVREELEKGGLFIMPSRTEGLPRAMVEAMACGLPCIGSAVGGIPELLADEDIFPVGNAAILAQRILQITADATRMQRMSERNLRRAEAFQEKYLRPRRLAFYRHVENATRTWIESRERSHLREATGNACSACHENV